MIGIARQDPKLMLPSSDDHRGVDDVRGPREAAELAGRSRRSIVKGNNAYERVAKQPDGSHLASAIPPDPRDDAGGHYERVAMVERPSDNRNQPPVIALGGHERAGVEDRAGHLPRARSASAASLSVSGPPVSASISSSRAARSSSFPSPRARRRRMR